MLWSFIRPMMTIKGSHFLFSGMQHSLPRVHKISEGIVKLKHPGSIRETLVPLLYINPLLSPLLLLSFILIHQPQGLGTLSLLSIYIYFCELSTRRPNFGWTRKAVGQLALHSTWLYLGDVCLRPFSVPDYSISAYLSGLLDPSE